MRMAPIAQRARRTCSVPPSARGAGRAILPSGAAGVLRGVGGRPCLPPHATAIALAVEEAQEPLMLGRLHPTEGFIRRFLFHTSASGHRPTLSAMGGLNRTGRSPAFTRYRMNPCASPLQATSSDPAAAGLAPTPPLTLSPPLPYFITSPSPGSEQGDRAMTDTPSHPPAAHHGPRCLTIPKAHSLRSSGSVQQNLSAMLPHGG